MGAGYTHTHHTDIELQKHTHIWWTIQTNNSSTFYHNVCQQVNIGQFCTLKGMALKGVDTWELWELHKVCNYALTGSSLSIDTAYMYGPMPFPLSAHPCTVPQTHTWTHTHTHTHTHHARAVPMEWTKYRYFLYGQIIDIRVLNIYGQTKSFVCLYVT